CTSSVLPEDSTSIVNATNGCKCASTERESRGVYQTGKGSQGRSHGIRKNCIKMRYFLRTHKIDSTRGFLTVFGVALTPCKESEVVEEAGDGLGVAELSGVNHLFQFFAFEG